MRLIWIFACFVALVCALDPQDTDKKRYDNFSVFGLKVENKIQLSLIKKLCQNSQKYTIWKQYDKYTRQVHIMVNPADINRFTILLKLYGINNKIIIPNVQSLIDNETEVNSKSTSSFGWKRYHNLAEIEAWLDEIIANYPDVVEPFVVGTSYEGRTIRGIKISYKANNPGVFIESNIHACEWITSATATWFINQLLTLQDEVIRELAESHDWYIVPVLNVDGFVYSHEKDRLWRKTRQPSSNSSCIGVDLNRNFDAHWMENEGGSREPCDRFYAGPAPNSEPETIALSVYLRSIKDKVNVFLAFHSYSQLLLSPYGYTDQEFPENYDHLQQVAKAYADAAKALPYGSVYGYGSTATTLLIASGSTVDFAYQEGIQISYTLEIRDTGHFGLVLPPAFIIPNCEETLAGIIALLGECQKLGYLELKLN